MEYADGVDLVYGGIRMKYRSKCTKDKEGLLGERNAIFITCKSSGYYNEA